MRKVYDPAEYWKDQAESWREEFERMVKVRDRLLAENERMLRLLKHLAEILEHNPKLDTQAQIDGENAAAIYIARLRLTEFLAEPAAFVTIAPDGGAK